MAKAPCMPAMGSHGPRMMRGGPPSGPVTHAIPAIISIVWAKPTRSRHGPLSPNAGMRTNTAFGLSSWITSHVSPHRSHTRGAKFSTTMSDCLTSSLTSSRPRCCDKSRVMPSLFVLTFTNMCPYSHHVSGWV